MKAVIMAGGEGTRLRPLTSNQPKPMLPVVNRPMMEHVVALLRRHGFTEIVVTVAFLADHIRAYFGDGSEFGVHIDYVAEETPLGTAGSVANAAEVIGDETFLVISGDVLTDVDLTSIVDYHRSVGAKATIGLVEVDNPLEFGIVITRPDGSIERFLEKPGWGQVFSDTINTGIYVLEPDVLARVARDRPVDFSGEVFPGLLEDGEPVFGRVLEGYWGDVGTLEAYLQAHWDCLDGRVAVDVGGFRLRRGVWIGEGCEIDPTAEIEGPTVLGDYCRIGPGARVAEHSVLGANVRIGEGAMVERTVVHDNCHVEADVRLRGCVVGRSTDLRRGARCEEGVVIGDHCLIGDHALVNASVKIFPGKVVEPGAVVNSSVVSETRAARSLFGKDGVSGLANVDLSPELAVRVAMAFGSSLKKGARVTVSRDTSRAARVLKRAVMVGLNASGVNVDDLEVATVPVTRFHTVAATNQGGMSVRLSAEDAQSVVFRFFDSAGIDLDEGGRRKVERLLVREEFRRALAAEIGDIHFPARTLDQYTAGLVETVDLGAIRRARFKVVLDYAFGTASFVLPNVLSKLGADVLAVNPFAQTMGAIGFNARHHAERVAELVSASGAHLGAVIDPDGEHLTVVDDAGQVLSNDLALSTMAQLAAMTEPGATIAVPIAASSTLEGLVGARGGTLVRTKNATADLLERASAEGAVLAGDRSGGFAFPAFLPAVDAVASLVHLLAMLAQAACPLSKVTSTVPRVHIAHEPVPTPWAEKGALMRSLVEELQAEGQDLWLLDGIRVSLEEGWALVLPDPEAPVTHVWAEAASSGEAMARAEEWASRVRGRLPR